MSLVPGEVHVLYSKIPEVSKITSNEQQMPNWQYYLIHADMQRQQHWRSQSVTETPTSSEDDVKTNNNDTEEKPTKQEQKVKAKHNRRKMRDSGRFVDIKL